MATPHPHSRGIFTLFGLFFLLLSACSAGQYDVQECDPSVPNIKMDLCSPLNDAMGMSGCMLYQCDNVSRRCVIKPLDYDRDGDPDPACGGHDCDDTDPAVYSTAVELCDNKDNNCNGVKDEGCACNPDLLMTKCSDGKGACERSVQWTCSANVPVCTAMALAPQGWHIYKDSVTNSADWNCNGVDEYACCNDMNCAAPTACQKIDCTRADVSCAQFCQPRQTFINCSGATMTYRCDDACGGSLAVCHCGISYLPIPTCQTSSITGGFVGCQ